MVKAANNGRINPHLKDRIRIVRGMVENKKVQEQVLQSGKVDTIVSEPIGVMLLHERMVSLQSPAWAAAGILTCSCSCSCFDRSNHSFSRAIFSSNLEASSYPPLDISSSAHSQTKVFIMKLIKRRSFSTILFLVTRTISPDYTFLFSRKHDGADVAFTRNRLFWIIPCS